MSFGGSTSTASEKSAKSSQKTINEVNPKLEANAADVLDFTKNFFSQYIAPQIQQLSAATGQAQSNNTDIYNLQKQQAADFKDLYDSKGKPAIENYLDTVKDFSTDAFADTQARLGIGDVRNQQAVSDATLKRQMDAVGTNAASPAALAVKAQSGVSYAVAAASQAARARDLANTQKLNLQSSGANLGVTLGQQAPNVTAAMNSTNAQGAAIPAANLQATSGAQQAQYPGYNSSNDAYATVLNAASGVNRQAVSDTTKAQTEDQAGWGKLAGTVLGIGAKIYTGGAA